MPGDIGVVITGDRKVALKFDTFPAKMHDRLLAGITQIVDRLGGVIRGGAPRGKTGKLQSEVETFVYDHGDLIVGRVGMEAGLPQREYAAAGELEYGGANKPFAVGAHQMNLDHAWSRRFAAPRQVFVKKYDRRLTNVGKRFFRGPFNAEASEITDELKQTVSEVHEGD